eukprot:scaffold3324_cov371-Prasinococcus_capsulatus_cf.AAC.13
MPARLRPPLTTRLSPDRPRRRAAGEDDEGAECLLILLDPTTLVALSGNIGSLRRGKGSPPACLPACSVQVTVQHAGQVAPPVTPSARPVPKHRPGYRRHTSTRMRSHPLACRRAASVRRHGPPALGR